MTGSRRQLINYLMDQPAEKLFDLKEHKEKRSMTQNSYYWVLLGKLADALRESKTVLHNRMIRSYGQLYAVDGCAVRALIPDTDEAEKKVLSMETSHWKPTSQVTVMGDGITYRTYVLMRGSSDLDTREMSILLDGLIDEAKQCEIETLTPRELEALRKC